MRELGWGYLHPALNALRHGLISSTRPDGLPARAKVPSAHLASARHQMGPERCRTCFAMRPPGQDLQANTDRDVVMTNAIIRELATPLEPPQCLIGRQGMQRARPSLRMSSTTNSAMRSSNECNSR